MEGKHLHKTRGWFVRILDESIITVFATLIIFTLKIFFALPFKILLAIAIFSLFLLVSLILIKRKKRILCFIHPLEPEIEIDWDRLGFTHYKEPDPLLVDSTHKLILIEQTYVIKGTDAQYILRYKGINITERVSRFIRDSVVGDSPMDLSLMDIRVVDKVNKTPLKWKSIKDSPYEKIIEIYFRKPLMQWEKFDIEWSCRWLGTFTRSEDYVFYPIHFYKLGVKKLIARIILSKSPTYIELIKINGKKANIEPLEPQIKNKNGKFVVTYKIDNPQFIYIVQFGRQDI